MRNSLYLLSLIVSLSCISCSNYIMLQEKPVTINADAGNALLVIYRSTSYKYNLVVSNYLNNQFIGQTIGKSYFVTRIKPGTYYLIGKSDNFSCRKISVDAGKVYYILQAIYPQEHHFVVKLPDDFMTVEKELTCYSVISDPNTTYPVIKETDLKKTCDQYDKLATALEK
jgi:Protein of unknown function (DUF2846)